MADNFTEYSMGNGSDRQDFLNRFFRGLLGSGDTGEVFGAADTFGNPGSLENMGLTGLRVVRRGLGREGFRLRDEEDRRREEALGLLRGGLADFDKSFADRERGLQGLQFSAMADAAGAGARGGIRNLRGLLGSRGLGASSGAASGLASRVALLQQGQIIGAKRDIALDAARRSALHSAQRQQLIGGIAGLTNQGPSMLGLDTLTNLHDSFAAQFSTGMEEKEARKARKAATRGAVMSGLGALAGAAF